MVSQKRFEVLIIGCGNIAGGFDMTRAAALPPITHAGAYTKNGAFRIRACVDPDENRRTEFARHWDVNWHATDLVNLNAVPGEFDVISICSPTSLHDEHIAQALVLRPRLIFCEKPLAPGEALVNHLLQECRSQGVTLVVNYSRRWDPAVANFLNHCQGGRWGAIRSVVGHYNKGILNNGSHMVDLLIRLLGPLEVVFVSHAKFDFFSEDPTVAALLSTVDGIIPVYLNPANASDYAYFELEIVCEMGVVRMLSGGMAWQFRDPVPSPQFEGYRFLDAAKELDGDYLETMSCAIEDIHQHLLSGSNVGCTGEDAIEIQKLCMRIQREALSKCVPLNRN